MLTGLAKGRDVNEVSSPMTPLLSLYLGLTGVAGPAGPLLLRWRRSRGKEDAQRWPERLGNASLERPGGPLLWIHGASVGESMSVHPLIARLRNERPDVAVLATSGTVSAARLARRLPEGALHQYLPLDLGAPVRRFLDHWRPDLAVCIESELWPRLLLAVRRRGIPALLLNARMSERSRARWMRFPVTASEILGTFDHVQAQDDATGAALAALGVPADRLTVAGSFKGAAAPLPCDMAELERMRTAVGRRRVWVAASTHRGEEAMAVEAHGRVTDLHRDALLIIAPRHPERGDEIADLLDASGIRWSRRADGPPLGDAAIYLADTLYELGLWYRIAVTAFVGGSTGSVGGHNPYEPIALDVPVVHGPDTANFSAVYSDLDAEGGARVVRSAQELADAVIALSDRDAGLEMSVRAAKIAGGGAEALELALRAITERLPPPEGQSPSS